MQTETGNNVFFIVNNLWDKILGLIETFQSPAIFEAWFKTSYPVEFNNGILVINMPSEIAKEMMEFKLSHYFTYAIKEICGFNLSFKFTSPEEEQGDYEDKRFIAIFESETEKLKQNINSDLSEFYFKIKSELGKRGIGNISKTQEYYS
jgi:chromosomal replication initiation ATPase DnaA